MQKVQTKELLVGQIFKSYQVCGQILEVKQDKLKNKEADFFHLY